MIKDLNTRRYRDSAKGKATTKRYSLEYNQRPEVKEANRQRARARIASGAFNRDQKRYQITRRRKVISWYGGKCVCCGELELVFLTLDHIKDDGAAKRKERRNNNGRTEYARVVHEVLTGGMDALPKDLQVLCFNCQWGKRTGFGFCPHHPERDLRIPLCGKEILGVVD